MFSSYKISSPYTLIECQVKDAFIGELALDGRIRPCNGVLSMVTEARKRGIRSVIVPYENRGEAESVTGIRVFPVKTLPDTIRFLEGRLGPCDEGHDADHT